MRVERRRPLGANVTFAFSDSDLLDLIEHIYAAGCDPADWGAFAAKVQAHVPRSAVHALFDIEGTQMLYNSAGAGIPDEFVTSYVAGYHGINPYNRLFMTLPVGKIYTSAELGPPGWLARDQFFNEWLLPAGNFTHGAGVVVAREHGRQMRFTLDLPTDLAEFEVESARFLQRITPHLRRAFAVNEKLAAAVATDHTLTTFLSRLEDAAAVLDSAGNVMITNPAAEKLIKAGKVVAVPRGKGLIFREPATDAAYRRALAAALDVAQPTASHSVVVDCPVAGRGSVLILPLRPKAGNLALSVRQAHALVIFRFAAALPLPPKQLLQAHYGLTAAEANVALKLVAGLTPQEAADELGVSPTTVRNQIAAILNKMGVRRQAELVAVICRLAPALKLKD